jgi:predicted nucleic-acid-binding protein
LGRAAWKIAADTNLLVRLFDRNSPEQTDRVILEFDSAEEVHISGVALCEFAWVMASTFRAGNGDIARMIRSLAAIPKCRLSVQGVEQGLACLEKGGDFSDGFIAAEGLHGGAHTLATFDRKALRILRELGIEAREPRV